MKDFLIIVGIVMLAWLCLTPTKEIVKTYDKVTTSHDTIITIKDGHTDTVIKINN